MEKLTKDCRSLGPTNTGKTHLAIEKMLQYENGILVCPKTFSKRGL